MNIILFIFIHGHISGVGYLKVPKNLDKKKKDLKTNGHLDFIHGKNLF